MKILWRHSVFKLRLQVIYVESACSFTQMPGQYTCRTVHFPTVITTIVSLSRVNH